MQKMRVDELTVGVTGVTGGHGSVTTMILKDFFFSRAVIDGYVDTVILNNLRKYLKTKQLTKYVSSLRVAGQIGGGGHGGSRGVSDPVN